MDDKKVTLSLHEIPWTDALRLAVARGGCEMRRTRSGSIVIERPKRVSLQRDDADVDVLLRAIASQAGTQILSDRIVARKLTVHLTHVPWRHAVDAVAEATGHVVVDEPDGAVRVTTRRGR